jgi:signal transduction histidine kinase
MPSISAATQTEQEHPFASSRMILRALADGILIVDDLGVVRQANPAAATLLGISEDALLGLRLSELPGGETLSRCVAEASGAFEVDGRSLRFSSAPLGPDHGREPVTGTLISLHDVSAELVTQQAQYDFISRALHDVRVPLQAIGGTTEGLLRGWFGPLNDEQREFLGTIKENVGRQSDLFSNIFDVYTLKANLVQLHNEQVSIAQLIHELAQEYAARYEARSLAFSIDAAQELPPVVADRRRLRQVLVALFENACKYTMPNGAVELRARAHNGLIRVDLQDTGVGIRAVDQPKIFTPFFRGQSPLKEGRYGGLNLAIARMIVNLLGGQMWFESVEGQGSTFSFTLPIPQAAPQPLPPTAR